MLKLKYVGYLKCSYFYGFVSHFCAWLKSMFLQMVSRSGGRRWPSPPNPPPLWPPKVRNSSGFCIIKSPFTLGSHWSWVRTTNTNKLFIWIHVAFTTSCRHVLFTRSVFVACYERCVLTRVHWRNQGYIITTGNVQVRCSSNVLFPPRTVLLENQFQSLNFVAFCRLLLHLVGFDLNWKFFRLRS